MPTLSFAPGFPAADFPHCGPSVFAYGVTQADADAAADAMAAIIAGHENDFDGQIFTPDEGVLHAMEIGEDRDASRSSSPTPRTIPAPAAIHDTTGMLRALVRNDAQRAAIGVIYDPASAAGRA